MTITNKMMGLAQSDRERISHLKDAIEHLLEIAKELRWLTEGEKRGIIDNSIDGIKDALKEIEGA